MREDEPLLRARHPDVGQAPLLLDPLLLDRAGVREDPLLHPDHEDGPELEPLRVVQREQRDEALFTSDRVLVGIERDLLQEARQARPRRPPPGPAPAPPRRPWGFA